MEEAVGEVSFVAKRFEDDSMAAVSQVDMTTFFSSQQQSVYSGFQGLPASQKSNTSYFVSIHVAQNLIMVIHHIRQERRTGKKC